MIAPTSLYDAFPAATPDEAAALLVRAITDRPKRIGTPLGTLGELMGTLAPKTKDAILHQAYRVFPDSASARGEASVAEAVGQATAAGAASSSGRVGVPTAPGMKQASRAAMAFMRLMPGVHW